MRNWKWGILSNAGNLESLLFEERADFGGLVALKFDAALANGAAASAGVAKTPAQFLDGGKADVRGEIVNDDDDFAAAMGCFAAQYHAAGFENAGSGRGGWRGRGWAGREAVGFQCGEGIVQDRRAAGGEAGFVVFGHVKNGLIV